MKKIEAALIYASWGWHVLPVVPNGKIPATQHGVNDATTDEEKIKAWWEQNPDYNVGIAAGAKSGIVVFDIDPRNGGDTTWDQWIESNGKAPDGAMQITAGGGQHYLAFYDESIRSCKLGDGIDLLSDGRYFVAYPSTIEGRNYEWEGESDPFDGIGPFVTPEKWMAAYTAMRKQPNPVNAGGGNLISGNRNNGLAAMGGAMRRYGMTEAEILAALTIANETRCEIPLPSSELSQIARSIGRYDPECDLAADMAIGHDAAEAILEAVKADAQDYYFTRATSYLTQPAPIQWVVKHWLPDYAVSMVFGESGSGKTFLALDMACHIASGSEWHGHKVKGGTVVYMAGEGNYGIRQRVASWCRHYNTDRLDNLLISNKAIDMDGPMASAQIINAVRELTQGDIAIIFIDTLNNHMSGNENDARDARNMLNAIQITSRALNSATCIVHHVGVASESKTRARGSSAWRASLDAQILVSQREDMIEVSCSKMKDTEQPQPIYGQLVPVVLGWVDEDGDEIKGAVFDLTNERPVEKPKKDSAIERHRKEFENAWWHSGAEERDEKPYLSRSGFADYLATNKGMKDSGIKQALKPSAAGKPIHDLILAGIIANFEHGWVVCEEITASAMIMRKGT